MERKLTAILSADVKGYSRLMGEDEEATIRTLTAYRTVMAPSSCYVRKEGTMKSFNWQDLLKGHPLFSSLTEEEIAQLLKDEASQEKAYPQGSVILSEGEYGDSLFLSDRGLS